MKIDDEVGFVPLDEEVGFVPLDEKVGSVPLDDEVGFVPLDDEVGFVPDKTQPEISIGDSKNLTLDEILSDTFDIEKHLDPEDSARLDALNHIFSKKELLTDLEIDAIFKSYGVDNDSLESQKIVLMTALDEKTPQGLLAAIKEGWKNSQLQIQIADIRLAQMYGQLQDAQAEKLVEKLKSQIQQTKTKGFSSFAKSAANLAPMMLDTTLAGIKYGAGTGTAAGALALKLGQAGPQLLLPEEKITVPTATVAGMVFGFRLGAATRAAEIETGLAYDELLSMKDEDGNKIDPAFAVYIAHAIGTINGLLELVQIEDLLKTIPGGKKLLGEVPRKTITGLMKKKTFRQAILGGAKKWAGHIGTETATEVLQETTNVIFGELAKNINNELKKTKLKPATIEEITNRLVETAKEAAKGFTVLSGPGNIVHTGMKLAEAANVPGVPGPTGEPAVGISRIMASERIIPRVDIDSLGKTMVEVPTELPPKKKRKLVKKETDLTSEEETLSQQFEEKLASEAETTITPNLYIGSLAQEAKKAIGEALGVDPEKIHGFFEGAWPTKRTKITLTMEEGRALLNHLETSLQNRIDNHLLKTDADIARANIDWGDIKELRKQLGLPKAEKPFVVIRQKGTRIIRIENVRERIQKTTRSGALDTVEITRIQQLNDVLRRAAKYAKEGYTAGKNEMREAYQRLRYLKKQKQLREKLIEKITAEPSENIDFFYREAIKELQNAIDWKTTTQAKKEKKAAAKQALQRNPDNYMNAPESLVKSFSQKDVADLSYNDLLILNEEINRLKAAGKLKSELVRKQRREAIEKETNDFVEQIRSLPNQAKSLAWSRAFSLRPMRIFDMLDGGKNFSGRIFKFFYQITNQNHNAEMKNIDRRVKAGKQRMAELGITIKYLTQKRKVGGFIFTIDEMLTVYAGWKNWAHQQKLRFGGIKTFFQENPIEITDQLYQEIMEQLSENDKLWADTIIAEYEQNCYDRLRNAVIAAENRDMGREENYTPAPTAKRGISSEQDMLDELSYRSFIRRIGPAKGFTIERKDIPPEYQNPIRSGLTKLWFEYVAKQEHYINNVLHIKDMQAIIRQREFSDAIREKFGTEVLETVAQYVSRVANPDFYKLYDDLHWGSRTLRKNAAIAYISWNLSSVLNQIPAILLYWVNSSTMDIIAAALDAAIHPMQAYERAKALHYQVSHAMMEREIIELEMADRTAVGKIIHTVGRAGMYGLFSVDRAVRVIGINAVYNYNIRQGMSPKEAQEKAVNTTLLTQEAASPKDLARLWATNEVLNWFLMFTNQLNQIFNIATYDIPMAFRTKNYREAIRSTIALSLMAMMIWIVDNRRLPEDEEDVIEAFMDQFISMIPLLGSWINAGRKGWELQLPPQTIIIQTTKGVNKILEGKTEKAIEYMTEPLSLVMGIPYQGPREAIEYIEEELD